MKVSLNLIKKYIDLPHDITNRQICRDLTIKTVEVEDYIDLKEKYHDIVVGKILEIKKHPNADKLSICMVNIGEENPVQIVCGGNNLYVDEYVVVALPGAKVLWHGEGDAVTLEDTLVRGEKSYGMICAASEVYLEDYFPSNDGESIVDLNGLNVKVGQPISEVIDADDIILEIDNKSLSNRPDLWGHYGIARELSAIYDVPLKNINEYKIDDNIKKYDVEIQNKGKCMRYVAIEIDGVNVIESPMWLKSYLIKCGLRPINAIVDITNYVMITTGQPMHAFDSKHIDGEKIIVRDAKDGEVLTLLDENTVSLTSDDLIIADINGPLALAGIKGGIKDSVLDDTKSILVEIASFDRTTIRKNEKRFAEKTDSGIRYEKGIDTARVEQAVSLTLALIKEIYPNSNIIAYTDNYIKPTETIDIDVSREFLNAKSGYVIDDKDVKKILTRLGYKINDDGSVYHVTTPVWRSTGDVSIKNDVLGDIARIVGYDNFNPKPIPINVDHAVIQLDVLLEKRIREYLSYRCGFDEVMTYSWVADKYLDILNIDKTRLVKLATPPSPELSYLRNSHIPSMLEVISKNLRYYETFKVYELGQVYEKGEYSPSTPDEVLPIHKKMITGAIVGRDAVDIFYELKGVIENMSRYCHMESIKLEQIEKPNWADINAYLNITINNEIIGSLGLLSVQVMNDSKIKRTNVAMFEINMNKLVPYDSRTNKYERLSELPLVEKDLSIIVDENIKWNSIEESIKSLVKEIEFVDEYKGNQIPENKKSITLKVRMINDSVTMTHEEINEKIKNILNILHDKCGAELRVE